MKELMQCFIFSMECMIPISEGGRWWLSLNLSKARENKAKEVVEAIQNPK